MKSIEEMAHDYALKLLESNWSERWKISWIAEQSFILAEAMQAEAEKRKDVSSNDFEVDWSQASEDATRWIMTEWVDENKTT